MAALCSARLAEFGLPFRRFQMTAECMTPTAECGAEGCGPTSLKDRPDRACRSSSDCTKGYKVCI